MLLAGWPALKALFESVNYFMCTIHDLLTCRLPNEELQAYNTHHGRHQYKKFECRCHHGTR